jgi:hypothetical protein
MKSSRHKGSARPSGGPARIWLATPCYGGMANVAFMRSVLDLQVACQQRGIGLHVELMGGDALITRARSRLAAQFLASDATHLFFVDADIGFRPENVFRLLKSGHDVCGGVYPLKRVEWDKARRAAQAGVADLEAASLGYVVRFIPTPDNSVEVDNGFAKVTYVGTGFMMLKREAVRRVADAHPELKAKMGDMADKAAAECVMLFETMIEPETGQYLSEDYAFCRRWRDLGGEIWADMESRLTHVGHTPYSGSLVQAMTLKA